MLDHFVDADIGLHPPVFGLLLDLALADDEARVQPSVVTIAGTQQLDTGEDGPTRTNRACFLDTLAVQRDEDLRAVCRANHTSEVGRPDAILPPPRVVCPPDVSLEHVPSYGPLA